IGKLIVHAEDRQTAIERMHRALKELRVVGIKTTAPLHMRIMRDSAFVKGDVHIHYLEKTLLKA
ncbi:MAG: acetyl-CoA carboxylase biotin carboxylase subunit, partial [Planctomycetes bacterium]|nr:acetyl-CoA carboxylase biotin carboxylase subunit [Planctomycetota bacterium]